VKFRVELVWTDNEENDASSIFLTSDGRVVLQGRAISPLERQAGAPGRRRDDQRRSQPHPRDQGHALIRRAVRRLARVRGPRGGTIENDGPCA
jgi:hypothetical protein